MTRPARLGALALLVTLALTAAAPVAAAPSHGGTRGVHVLIDSNEYPGQICHYDDTGANALHRIALRRPVIFAPDVSSKRDKRWVGWRYRLQRSDDGGGTWSTFYRSTVKKAVAYDDQPASLPPRGHDFTGDSSYLYRSAVDLYWYTATSATNQTGHATHTAHTSLEVVGDLEASTNDACPGTIDVTAAALAPSAASPAGAGHGGEPGLHTLIDSPDEYPGATCVYNGNTLVKIKVRAPVVYAQETVSGPQQVRWRFEIDASDGGPTTRVHTSTWTKAPATEFTAARWRGRSIQFDSTDWDFWIVSVRMEWLGAGSPNPYAVHTPYHAYNGNVFGYCST